MQKIYRLAALLIFVFFLMLYVFNQSHSIYGGDSGDLVSAAHTLGVAHPPGYPLYTALGYGLIHAIDYGTPAWRVTLLSSLSIATALGLLALYAMRTYKTILPVVIAIVTLGLTYIYWLYASVPEVFGLHILLMTAQLLTLRAWEQSYSKKWLLGFVFLFVLSVFHHQIILFMLPAYIYFFLQHKKRLLKQSRASTSHIVLVTSIALLPLLYFPLSINSLAGYTWADTLTFAEVIKIITRSTYGSFVSAAVILEKPLSRLTDVYAYFLFMLEDFGLLGFALALIGSVADYIRRRKIFMFHALAFLFTGPFFLFYGAYILSNNFTIATFERFVLPSYVIVALWIVSGVHALSFGLDSFIRKIRENSGSSIRMLYAPIILAIIAIVPLTLFMHNYPKISLLTYDTTAEDMAMNILDTAEPNAILLLSKDNEVFNASYAYYALGYRPDVAMFNASHLLDAKIYKQSVRHYPDIVFPDEDDPEFAEKFVEANIEKRPIYTNEPFRLANDYLWVREGLLSRLYPKDNLPAVEDILATNTRLWNTYRDPLGGALSEYKHLMLASNLLTYRIYRVSTGDYFFAEKKFAEAEDHYRAAIRYDQNDVEAYHRLAAALSEQKKCDEAERVLLETNDTFAENLPTKLFLIKLYTDCIPNESKATFWRNEYDELSKKSQQKLKEL